MEVEVQTPHAAQLFTASGAPRAPVNHLGQYGAGARRMFRNFAMAQVESAVEGCEPEEHVLHEGLVVAVDRVDEPAGSQGDAAHRFGGLAVIGHDRLDGPKTSSS